jgi:hypothetical protein
MICPVCKKAGIKEEDLICPQCNSDLSQLKLVSQLESKINKWKRRNYLLLSGVALLLIILTGIFLYTKVNLTIQSRLNSSLIIKSDSLAYYRHQYLTVSKEIDAIKDNGLAKVYINYRVKKGDNLSSIARIFYSDINLASKIAIDNNLNDMNHIYVNQILKIEVKK